MARMALATNGTQVLKRIRPEVRLIEADGPGEHQFKLTVRLRPIHTQVRIMVENVAKQLGAIPLVAGGVEDVGMPEEVDQAIRDEVDGRVGQVQAEEAPVLAFCQVQLSVCQTLPFKGVREFGAEQAEVECGY